jgi:hypothetical protein
MVDVILDFGNQFGLQIIEKFDQVQILESPVAWPYATIDIPIRYSDKEDSGWGRHVSSAKNLGLAQQATSVDQAKAELVNKVYEMRQFHETYGSGLDKDGKSMSGNVWRFQRIVSAVLSPPMPQYQPPIPQTAPAPTYQAQPPTPQPVVTPMAPPAPIGFNAQLLPTDTSMLRAKKLLHGRVLNEFLGVALLDDIVKKDPAFVNTIFDQSFIVGLKASNQIVQDPATGRFTVIA